MNKVCQCGKAFNVSQWEVKVGRHKYCSKQCYLAYRDKPTGWTGKRLSKLHKQHISQAKQANPMNGNKHWNYKRGKWVDARGYVLLKKPNHPNAKARGYILEHRYIMSNHLGRPLRPREVVHHINHNTMDNRIANLQLMDVKQHVRLHHKGKL